MPDTRPAVRFRLPDGARIQTHTLSAGPGDIVSIYADGHVDVTHALSEEEAERFIRFALSAFPAVSSRLAHLAAPQRSVERGHLRLA